MMRERIFKESRLVNPLVFTGRILSITLFVCGVAFYLLFSTAHPLLHNHPIDGKHHPNCPSCNFIVVALFATIPDVIIVIAFIFLITCLLFRSLQQFYKKLFDKSHFVRGPPVISL